VVLVLQIWGFAYRTTMFKCSQDETMNSGVDVEAFQAAPKHINQQNFTKNNSNIRTLITKSEKNTIPTFRYQWPTSSSQISTSVFEMRLQFLQHFAKNRPPLRLPCLTFPQFHVFITCFCDFFLTSHPFFYIFVLFFFYFFITRHI